MKTSIQEMRNRKTSPCRRLWLSLLLLTMSCAWIEATPEEWKTMRESLPAYAITDYIRSINSSKCQEEMEMYREAIDQKMLWGLRTLDASGRPNSGFTTGNNYWPGNRIDCYNLNANATVSLSPKNERNDSLYRNRNEEYPPIELNFFSVRMRHYSTAQYHIHALDEDTVLLGLCLPKSCTKNDIFTLMDKMLHNKTLLVEKLYSMHLEVTDVSTLTTNFKWLLSPQAIISILILSLALGLVTLGTLYDIVVYQKRLRKKMEFLAFENNNTTELKNEVEEKCESNHNEQALSLTKPENRLGEYLICFSCYSNMHHIFKTDSNSESIDMFHGLRFLGMIWIIIAHTLFYGVHNIGNRYAAVLLSENVFMQILSNGTFSVDTYFFTSGFLLSFVFLKAQKKQMKVMQLKTKVKQFFSFIIKRYIRLTPAVVATIAFAILNFKWHAEVSMFLAVERPEALCSKYWWRTVFYVNNFFHWNEICLTWTWYLSNDMQYFILGVFLLLLSLTYYKTAVSIGIILLFGSIFMNAYMTYELQFIPTFDGQYETLTTLYQRPWYRIAPYLIGIATSQLLTKWNYKLHLSRKVKIVCWTLAIFCNCSVLFGIADRRISLSTSILYTALSRTSWAFGISWLVIACCTNNGGIVNRILSYSFWIPLSKLTYCSYLLNPIIILSFYSYTSYTLFVDLLVNIFIFTATIIITYVCAVLLSLISEVPFITLQRLVASPRRRTK